MNENIFVSGGDLVINYSLKIGGVVAPLGSVPFSLRYYNPNDESNYVEASFDGNTYNNITPEDDHYVIGIKDVNFEVGRMFCWERIQVSSPYFADGKRTDSSRYDVGEIVKETTNLDNINTQVNFLQGVWFNFPNRYVDVLPAVGANGVFYFVPNGGNATNIYIYSDAEFHLVGSTSISLADFYTKAEINSLLSNCVLKVPGSGLITDLERDRLTHAVDTHESQINIHSSQIQDIVTTYINNKGYFATLTSLQASYPTPEIGDIAYVADALSSTGYYIYNVVDGVWTSSTVEAPPVAVPIGDYTLNGGSSKTLKEVDDEITKIINSGALYKGLATPSTNPGTPDGPQFYFATQKGTYSNFGGIVVSGKACILSNSTGVWVKSELGLMLYDDAIYSLLSLNSATGENSYYINISGAQTNDPNYHSSNFLAVTPSESLFFIGGAHPNVSALAFYDSSKTFLLGTNFSVVSPKNVISSMTVPTGAVYVKASYLITSSFSLIRQSAFKNALSTLQSGLFVITVDYWDQVTINAYITKTGALSSTDANWRSTDFIACTEGDTIDVRLTGHIAVNNVSFYNGSYSFISGVGVTSGSLYAAKVTVPAGASYMRISGGSDVYSSYNLPHYANQDLLVNIFDELDSMNAKIGNPVNIPYIYPRTIYTTCNDVGSEINGGRKRNYSAAVVIDHLFNRLTSEKEIRVKGGVDKVVFTSPLVVTDSSETTPAITYNNGSNVIEISTPVSLKGKDIVESNFNIIHRSALNSITSSVHPKILCIGDSITYGEQALIPDDGFAQNHVYHLIAKELFMKDAIDNGGSGFNATFLGIYEKTKSFNYKGSNYNVKTHHEGIRGISLASHLSGGVSQFWNGTNWSLQSWIDKYRTLDDNGVRLTLGSGTGTLINSGNLNTIDVCTPTHVLIMLGANGGGTLTQYQQLVNYIKTEFPNIVIGIAIPDAAGTYFPSLHPKCSELCTFWNDTGSQGSRKNQQYGLQNMLQLYYDNSTQESQNIYMVPFYYVAPSAESVALRKTDIIDADFSVLTGNNHFNHFGWHASTHVNGVGQISWGYQLYSWIKYTIAKSI